MEYWKKYPNKVVRKHVIFLYEARACLLMKGAVTVVVWCKGVILELHLHVCLGACCNVSWAGSSLFNLTVENSSTLPRNLVSVNILSVFFRTKSFYKFLRSRSLIILNFFEVHYLPCHIRSSWISHITFTLLSHYSTGLLLRSHIKTLLWFIVQHFWAHPYTKLA
jgi:hypothetical protein